MMSMNPVSELDAEPYATGMHDVGDGHQIY